MSTVISFIKIHSCILETGEKMPPKTLTILDLVVLLTLTFDLLTSKPYQLIFVPNCNEAINLVKFKQAVNKNIVNKLLVYYHKNTRAHSLSRTA